MNEECLICKAPLKYSDTDETMECSLCGKSFPTKAKCINNHFVCDTCHTGGMDTILSLCLKSESKNPFSVLEQMMSLPTCHMHGPEHHVMVGSALLTAYKNSGGAIDLESALIEMQKRAKQVPGGVCGFWGACGAGISTGMFVSIATKSTPLAKEEWSLSNLMTSSSLCAISKNGGPRCCKRDSYLALYEAIKFTKDNLGIAMESSPVTCSRAALNNQCIGSSCPFHKSEKKKIAFICVHNSCRSQIAEALGKHLASDVFDSFSAGSEPKASINPDAVRLMKTLYGIDMEKTQFPKLMSAIPVPDVAISMGCNAACPLVDGSFDDNWLLDDPTGKSDEEFIKIIKKTEENILLLKEKYK